ncbi:MAG: hypothetical protein K0S09_2476 [Sphingobacteriaceae bacterium]|nr:hypothetical protein [Sphingobacteriaceae bacterium]
MHFGKLVKGVAHSYGLSANELADSLGRTEREVLELYEQEEWTSGTIKRASVALEHDFGKYLNNSYAFNFMSQEAEQREFVLTIKYPKGKEFLLKTWLRKLALIAQSIGLEISK